MQNPGNLSPEFVISILPSFVRRLHWHGEKRQ
jgi:hypothetical protein